MITAILFQVKKMNKFWNWAKDGSGHILKIEGVIADNDTWLENEVTPKFFEKELAACNNEDVTVQINSYGGDVFCAAQIYTDLKNYRGKVEVEIILAASAASVIAMAGDVVLISPTGAIMVHDPSTAIFGNSAEMKKAAEMLDSVKETIINAYQLKTGLSRNRISEMMTAETWLSAKAALDLHFVDKILYTENQHAITDAVIYSEKNFYNRLLKRISPKNSAENFYGRLESRKK